MLLELAVENLAIIERAQLAFGPGFTVLTGETGAGKSLLVDALELALGERADSELVRHGSQRASVSLAVDLSSRPELAAHATDLGLPLEESTLYIQREVSAEGRSQCRVGGKLMPVSGLKQLGAMLVDLHGQHEHQSLLIPDRHGAYLDAWIGAPAYEASGRIAEAYARALALRERLEALRASLRDREQRIDLLRFQVSEIESARITADEMQELESRLSRLRHAEKLSEASSRALDLLQEREGAAVEQIGEALKALDGAARLDRSLEATTAELREGLQHIDDGVRALAAYADSIDANSTALEELAGRMDLLKRLRRKYGDDETAVLAHLESCKRELATLEDAESSEEQLASSESQARKALERECEALTTLRKTKGKEFSKLVQSQLRDLAMERAVFDTRILPKPPSHDGADLVEFYFSANAGEPVRPLSKIASGGEISRVMLAMKCALAGKAAVPTLVFDEVDAGLGGRAAAVVAGKLADLAKHHQILVISHLPQIASRASAHYRVEKVRSGAREVVRTRLLEPEERVQEVARMLAGEQVSETALVHAQEMMQKA